MNVVDTLYIALGIDSSKIDKGIATAQTKLSTGLKSMVGKVFAPLMAGISFGALFDSLQKELGQMNRMSKAYRVNIEDMTAWSRAVVDSGGNVEALEGTLSTLNQNLTKISVTGSSRAKPFFEAMGLDAQNLAKKPVLNALEDIAVAVEGMDKLQSANMLRSMGFDSGTIKLLQSGTKNIKELIARQKELGVYTDKDAKALTQMNKGFREIVAVLKSSLLPLFVQVIGVASKVTRYLVNGIVFLRKNVMILRGALLLLAAVFSKQLLSAVKNFWLSFRSNPFGMFIAGLTMLLLLLEDLWVYAKGGKTAFGNIWKNLGSPEEVMKKFQKAGETIGRFFKFLGGLFNGEGLDKQSKFLVMLVGGIALLIAAIGWIPVAIAAATAVIVGYWDEIEKWVSDVIEAFKSVGRIIVGLFVAIFGEGGLLNTIFDAISDTISELLTNAKDSVNNAFESVREVAKSIDDFFAGIIDSIKNKWKSFTDTVENGWNKIKNIFSFDVKMPTAEAGEIEKPDVPQLDAMSIGEPDVSAVKGAFDYISGTWDSITESIGNSLKNTSGNFAEFGDNASDSIDDVSASFENTHSLIGEANNALNDFAESSVWESFKESANDALTNVSDTVFGAFGSAKDYISSSLSDMGSSILDTFNKGGEVVSSALDNAKATASNVGEDIVSFAYQSISEINAVIQTVIGAVSSTFNSARDIVDSIFGTIRSIIAEVWEYVVSELGISSENIKAIFDNIKAFVIEAWGIIEAEFKSAFERVTALWNGLISAFQSGCSAIAGFLSNAANTARGAWESFISWLESKWNWLKELLPSFEKIAGALPRIDVAPKMAMAGASNTVSNSVSTDNSVHNTTINTHTAQATNAAMEKVGYVSMSNSGVRRR